MPIVAKLRGPLQFVPNLLPEIEEVQPTTAVDCLYLAVFVQSPEVSLADALLEILYRQESLTYSQIDLREVHCTIQRTHHK